MMVSITTFFNLYVQNILKVVVEYKKRISISVSNVNCIWFLDDVVTLNRV